MVNLKTGVLVRGKKCLFFGNMACFAFLLPPFLYLPFYLITDEKYKFFKEYV